MTNKEVTVKMKERLGSTAILVGFVTDVVGLIMTMEVDGGAVEG